MTGYSSYLHRSFTAYTGSLVITTDTRFFTRTFCKAGDYEFNLLPLMLLAMDAPKIRITFIPQKNGNPFGLQPLLVQDLHHVIYLSRQKKLWSAYLRGAIKSLTLYTCGLYEKSEGRGEQYGLEPDLHIEFNKNHEESWMHGTHTFKDLEAFLKRTGLDKLTELFVHRDKIDWLLNSGKTKPGL
ncbi:hypothetical protein BDW02DRAFT_595323 [Decorospora gaudefroyi]|uniref:Uncharacterized protein n=1 Tax=Decorospora gaudefroyi TaxID=184978 RepID=A0A6A5KT59_9PLEO|nr:hypothetical protein BDW02DRAFT_595323 [Decorospora gaudefroyi]